MDQINDLSNKINQLENEKEIFLKEINKLNMNSMHRFIKD